MESSSESKAPETTGNCCVRVRNSKKTIVLMVFFGLLTDNLLLTLVDPILPDILHNIDGTNATDDTRASHTINSNGKYGYLVAAKGATQFLCNPFVGLIVTRFGYRVPMYFGSLVLLGSTVAFAYAQSYWWLFVTRMVQGASSSVTAVTGMGLLAASFTDDHERGKVMGIAIGGLSLGIVVGPIYGSLLYQFCGQATPFLVLAAMILFDIFIQTISFRKDTGCKDGHSLSSLCRLLADPYILIVAGAMFLLNLDVSMVLAFLPIRLIDLQNPEPWALGVVVLPTSIGYLVASVIFPRMSKFLKRWLCAFIGLMISASTMAGLAFSTSFVAMLVVTTFLGVALGMVSTSMQPLFAEIVDLRHGDVYGNVYAISDMAVCAAFFVGPLAGGAIMYQVGFQWMILGIAILNLGYAQFCFILRKTPPRFLNYEEIASSEESPLCTNARSRSGSQVSVKSRSRSFGDVPMPRCVDYMSSIENLQPKTYYIDHV